MRKAPRLVGLVFVSLVGVACARRSLMMEAAGVERAVIAPCDEACYKQDRDRFSSLLQAVINENTNREKPEKKGFNGWSAAGIVVGLAGGLMGLVLPHDNDRKNVATGTSITAGAITGWLATRKFETRAAKYEACVTAAGGVKFSWEARYSNANLPDDSDPEAVKLYNDTKAQFTKQVTDICPAFSALR